MNKRIGLVLLASLLVILVVGGMAGAQSSESFDLSWYVLGGGGEGAAGDDYALNGTLGQGMVAVSGGGGSQMYSGYWKGAVAPRYGVYLPLVLRDS